MNNTAMLLGLVAGLALGLAASLSEVPILLDLASWSAPFGDIFIRGVQMVVIPLVVAIVFTGVAGMGDTRTLGRIGGASLGFIVATTVPAVAIGMGGMGLALQFLPAVASPEGAAPTIAELPSLVDFVVNLIPRNPFQAAAEGRLLPLLVFAILLGAAAGTLPAAQRDRLVEIADAASAALIRLVEWVLWTAPIGIFGLVAPATARMGLGLLQSLAVFVAVVVVGLAILIFLVYVPLVASVGRVPPSTFLRHSLASFTVGFTTTSSVATLPVLLRDAPKLEISEQVCDVVIPLAAALNRAGSGLFQGAAVVFLVSLYDIPVPTGAWIGAGIAVFFAASTVAPVPSASIMTLAPALSAVGAPMAGLGLLLGIDRVPDMFRSGTNQVGHMATAAFTQGVLDRAAPRETGGRRSVEERTDEAQGDPLSGG
jgi:Na+/H+-dicarboxylate symporter